MRDEHSTIIKTEAKNYCLRNKSSAYRKQPSHELLGASKDLLGIWMWALRYRTHIIARPKIEITRETERPSEAFVNTKSRLLHMRKMLAAIFRGQMSTSSNGVVLRNPKQCWIAGNIQDASPNTLDSQSPCDL